MNGEVVKLSYSKVLDHGLRLFPIIVFLFGCYIWVFERLESPEEKTARTEQLLRPTEEAVERLDREVNRLHAELDQHNSLDGHPVISAKFKALEAEIRRIHKDGD